MNPLGEFASVVDFHPLTEYTPDNDMMNLWGAASMIAHGAINGSDNSLQVCKEAKASKTLVSKAKYNKADLRMLQLKIHDFIEQKFDQTFSK